MNGHLADRIRKAFASEEFAKAQRLWSEYAVQLQRRIAAGTATPAMLSETRELIDWSTRVVKALQAHTAAQLKSLHLASRYQTPAPQPRAGVQVSF
jgi:hypothetical protein